MFGVFIYIHMNLYAHMYLYILLCLYIDLGVAFRLSSLLVISGVIGPKGCRRIELCLIWLLVFLV